MFAKMSYEHLANCLLFAFVCDFVRLGALFANTGVCKLFVFEFVCDLPWHALPERRAGPGSPPKPYLLLAASPKVSVSLRRFPILELVGAAAGPGVVMGKEEVEMCSVLRINRGFMEYARKHHAEAAMQQFNKTVVDDAAPTAPCPAPQPPAAAASAGAGPSSAAEPGASSGAGPSMVVEV